VEGAVEISGFVDGVSVGEEKPAATSLECSRPAGVVFAGPAWLKRERRKDCDAREAGSNLASPVGGVVIDDKQFPIGAELEDCIRLGSEGAEAVSETLLFITGRDDYGEFEGGFGEDVAGGNSGLLGFIGHDGRALRYVL
jgi:hypothetical protein